MQILASIIISALMVFGAMQLPIGTNSTEYKQYALGASQTISSLTAGTSLDDADTFVYVDNSGTPTTKKITVANATSSLKTFYDTVYSPIFSTSAGFFALISDETGSSGGVVRATSPTITTATLASPTLDVAGTDATGDLYYNGGSGLLTRLADAVGTGYYLMSSSTTGLPEWNNSVATFPYNASSTFTATTSFNGSSLTNNAIIINSLAYQFPSARGGQRGQFLTDTNGTGVLVFASTTGMVFASTTDSSFASGASVVIISTTIPAGTLSTQQVIHGKFYLDWIDASATGKDLTLNFGGTNCAVTNTSDLGASATYKGYMDFYIVTTTSATAQECSLIWDGANVATHVSLAGTGSSAVDNSASLALTVTASQNSSGETVSIRNGFIEILK
jgi:hypothetical protein